MPFQLKPLVELEQHFTIEKVKGIPEITENDPVTVAVRQATERENRLRENFIVVPITQTFSPDSDYGRNEWRNKPIGERRTYEVYLTLAECDVLDRKGDPLFKFHQIDGLRKVAGSFEDFQKRWGMLPSPLAVAIHAKCVEVNPDWDFRWELDEEDTEGEN